MTYRSYDECAFYKAMMGAVKAEGNLDYDAEKSFTKNQLEGQNEVKKAIQEAGYYRDRIRRKISITF